MFPDGYVLQVATFFVALLFIALVVASGSSSRRNSSKRKGSRDSSQDLSLPRPTTTDLERLRLTELVKREQQIMEAIMLQQMARQRLLSALL